MNTFTLKMIALVLMVIDHIGYYFEGTPSWLRWLGRGSYPLFLFCMVWGYQYTRNRKRYLLRLYLMSLFMTFFSYTVDAVFVSQNGYGNHNIFSLHVFGRRAYQHSGAISEGSEKGCRPVGRDSLCPAAVFPHAQYYSLYT